MNGASLAETIGALARELIAQRRIPCATYRLQLNRQFTFRDALAIVPYLDELGITDLYVSPIFKARTGSPHGYDVCDPGRLNPELGDEQDFAALTAALRERGMGLLLDMVPNHMGIGEPSNTWWTDLLENGPGSEYASYFDIDWQPVKPELHNKVLLPLLEDQYGKVLESGKLQLAWEEGAFALHHYETRLPIAPRTYSLVIGCALERARQSLPPDNEHLLELQSILTAIGYLPPRTETDPEKRAERSREKEIIKRRLAAVHAACREVRDAIEETVRAFNGAPGEPRSFDRLDELIDAQAYRVAFWRVAADEINYRRFFDINELAAICVENPAVFAATHQLLFLLLEQNAVTGLRIDHPDGLWDPPRYFRQLQQQHLTRQICARLGDAAAPEEIEAALGCWLQEQIRRSGAEPSPAPLYVVAEKILSVGEPLPEDWAVDGTTGYDFLNDANGLFVDARHAKAFDKLYAHFLGSPIHFRNLVNSTKKTIMLVSLASEIHVLSHRLDRISEKNRWYRDFTLNSLIFAIREVIAALPVYRTYITGPGQVTDRDRQYIEAAVAEAKRRNPRTARALFHFIRDTLLLQNIGHFREEDQPRLTEFVMKFQQLTGPVMAKGVEDTAFYVYNRLASLNEVGGHPETFGVSPAEFHERNRRRARRWPHAMLAGSTHDTKRSEDVRARINVLSELPDEWRTALSRWTRLNAGKKTVVDGGPAPDRNEEYLFYQTLLGAWPISAEPDAMPAAEEWTRLRERMLGYMQKATREAKVHTSWIAPNDEYDAAVRAFVERVLEPVPRNRFLKDLAAFQKRIALLGRFNGLSQQLLRLTAPGVPDIYQGTELWDLSLVDPDNRRPVDYKHRQSLLCDLKTRLQQADAAADAVQARRELARALTETDPVGLGKLWVTYATLQFRHANAELFRRGDYVELSATGQKQAHVVAFARTWDGRAAVVVCPRLVAGLTGATDRPPVGAAVWQDTSLSLPAELAGASFRNLLTAAPIEPDTRGLALATLLADFPVALLHATVS
jgi:(1->4)-alpha-D-glucan 1-alpha-D-glucosylmutase